MTKEENWNKEQLIQYNRMKKIKQRKARKRRKLFRLIKAYLVIFCFLLIIIYGSEFLIKSIWIDTKQKRTAEEQAEATQIASSIENTKAVNFSSTAINEELKENLTALSGEEPRISEILNNINEYPENILEMLVSNQETIDFVLDYPEKKNEYNEISIKEDYKEGVIPLFLQWDERWGYCDYGDNIIAINGCGPTSLSMVLVYLTKDLSYNPRTVAEFSEREGYLDESGSTMWGLMTEGSEKLGINSKELPLDESTIINELLNNHPIICSMRPGDFTTTGHFIVITGYGDGKYTIHDPNSIIRSNEKWYYKTLKGQIKNLWSFSL